jgi:polyferredoxin
MSVIATTCNISTKKSFNHKWLLGLIMVTVITLGWKFPLLGFVVPIAMSAGIIGGFFRGRWVCGNACPRGSFLDTWFNLVSGKRDIPALLKNTRFRWLILSGLMILMAFRLSQNPGEINHWGLVFWQMCMITTIAAAGLGIGYSARSWCSICPVGTMAGTAGREKHTLQVSSACKACGVCENSCPMQLEIARYRHSGKSEEQDCLKCSSCINACPGNNLLSWPTGKAA